MPKEDIKDKARHSTSATVKCVVIKCNQIQLLVEKYMCQNYLPLPIGAKGLVLKLNERNTKTDTNSNGCYQWSRNLLTRPEYLSSSRLQWGSCCSIFSFICNVIQIVVCPFSFWALCCLSFDLRIPITLWYLQTLLPNILEHQINDIQRRGDILPICLKTI